MGSVDSSSRKCEMRRFRQMREADRNRNAKRAEGDHLMAKSDG
jgi:hypothetical protein